MTPIFSHALSHQRTCSMFRSSSSIKNIVWSKWPKKLFLAILKESKVFWLHPLWVIKLIHPMLNDIIQAFATWTLVVDAKHCVFQSVSKTMISNLRYLLATIIFAGLTKRWLNAMDGLPPLSWRRILLTMSGAWPSYWNLKIKNLTVKLDHHLKIKKGGNQILPFFI